MHITILMIQRYAARVLDARGQLSQHLTFARQEFEKYGLLHITRTNFQHVLNFRPLLYEWGFQCVDTTREEQHAGQTSIHASFHGGGRHTSPLLGLRRLDHYPPHLELLPNQELQYLRRPPEKVFFFCQRATPFSQQDGRTFFHSALEIHQRLLSFPVGRVLCTKLRQHGLLMEFGYLDRHHPFKSVNYFKSWQELLQTECKQSAMEKVNTWTHRFDRCWWRMEEEEEPTGGGTLMTQLIIPGFNQQGFLTFPRIAMDPPHPRNGFRQFRLGNGEGLTMEEISLLRHVYRESRSGLFLQDGDILLMDNRKFGHSREPYVGERDMYVAFGMKMSDSLPSKISPTVGTTCSTMDAKLSSSRNNNNNYQLPSLVLQPSMWVFDAGQNLYSHLKEIQGTFTRHGICHVINTGLGESLINLPPQNILDALGFTDSELFTWGGKEVGERCEPCSLLGLG